MKILVLAFTVVSICISITGCAQPATQSDGVVRSVIEGERESGGFDYDRKSGRNDSNYVGWHGPALKAAPMTSTNDLNEAMRKAVEARKGNQGTEP